MKANGKAADGQIGLGGEPAVAVPKRKPHRATGIPRGGRRIYDANGQFVTNKHIYSPAVASEILSRMADGETVSEICRSRSDMPHRSAVWAWCLDHEGFGSAYARAERFQAQSWGDDIYELSKDRDTDPSVRRVEFDMKKWLMSKNAPTIYGDKLTVAGDPDAPLVHVHKLDQLLATMTGPELDALERFAQARLEALEQRTIEGQAIDVTEDSKRSD